MDRKSGEKGGKKSCISDCRALTVSDYLRRYNNDCGEEGGGIAWLLIGGRSEGEEGGG